jgi:hypothetical protein
MISLLDVLFPLIYCTIKAVIISEEILRGMPPANSLANDEIRYKLFGCYPLSFLNIFNHHAIIPQPEF